MTIAERIFEKIPQYSVETYGTKNHIPEVKLFNNFFEALHYAEQFDEASVSPEGEDYVWFNCDSRYNTITKAAIVVAKLICEYETTQQQYGGGSRKRRKARNIRRICINNAWWRQVHPNDLPF